MAHDPKPFALDVTEESIERRRVLSWLVSDQELAGGGNSDETKLTECWDNDWSDDYQYFAWSCGRRIVKIVPTSAFHCRNELNGFQPGLVTIDCRQIVTSLAFANCSKAVTKYLTSNIIESSYYRAFHWEKYHLILAVGLRNGRIRIFDVYTGRVLLELIDHSDCISSLLFSPDDSLMMLSSSSDGTLKYWDLTDDGNMVRTIKVSQHLGVSAVKHRVCSASWSPDGKRVAAVGSFKTVLIFDAKDQEAPPKKLQGHLGTVTGCDFSPDGVLLATCSVDTVCYIWNSFTGDVTCKLGHQFPPPSIWFPKDTDTVVRACRFSANGDTMITISSDGFVRFWDLTTPVIPSHIAKVHHATSLKGQKGTNTFVVGTNMGSVAVLEAPLRCPTLTQLCRQEVNRLLTNQKDEQLVAHLPLPIELADFLNYRIINLQTFRE